MLYQAVFHFTPKHRWQVKLHIMSGETRVPAATAAAAATADVPAACVTNRDHSLAILEVLLPFLLSYGPLVILAQGRFRA